MTQKERALLVIKSIIVAREEISPRDQQLLKKIDACLSLIRPEVLLDEKERKIYDTSVEELRRSGKII